MADGSRQGRIFGRGGGKVLGRGRGKVEGSQVGRGLAVREAGKRFFLGLRESGWGQ